MESAQFLNPNAPQPAGLPDEGLQMMSAMNPQLYGQQQPMPGPGGEQPTGGMIDEQMMQQDVGAAIHGAGLQNVAPPAQDDRAAAPGQQVDGMDEDAVKEE